MHQFETQSQKTHTTLSGYTQLLRGHVNMTVSELCHGIYTFIHIKKCNRQGVWA